MHSLALALGLLGSLAVAKDTEWLSPVYKDFYQYPLPIPPIKTPYKSYDNLDYYEIDIKPVDLQIYPNLKKTRHVGYDGMVPGPTFMVERGREAVVRFVNHADRANSVHLHGSYSRAPFDGWAEDTTEPGQYKDYYYPNAQNARTLWYHDHAIDHTAENAYSGQAGFYIMHDAQERASNLPMGQYDVPLALAAKRYNSDGSLWSPEANGETVSVFGDVIQVNGQPWPYMAVEPRKYRFRFLDSSISRSFQMYFEADKKAGTRLGFNVIGSDTGLLTKPIPATQLDISMAERWEIVFDFTGYEGQNVTLRNNRKVGADDDYAGTDKVMRFVIGSKITSQDGNGPLPATLRSVKYPPKKDTVDRHFKFERSNGQWQVNGISWASGPEARVIAKPERGAVEVWELENSSGGWTHPIHIHLIDFQILNRSGGERNTVLPYEAAGLKDVVWLNRGETVKVIARYAPWDGLYMFHCHNLIHEDHEMMAAMDVKAIKDLGYDEKTTFLDPMDSTYRSKGFKEEEWQSRDGDFEDEKIGKKCEWFISLEAYKNADEVEGALETYWSTHTATTLQTSIKSSGSAAPSSSSSATPTSAAPTSSASVTSSASTKSDDKKTTTSSTAKTTSTKKR
ncbi:hypothetical protein AAFC00_006499 [Neodothiora populina]|uniref:Bilirubin oxidase n=1 Tax=Neodothiora populina TaxID=2781224 RepID=A0ABR3P5R0_9PEZI